VTHGHGALDRLRDQGSVSDQGGRRHQRRGPGASPGAPNPPPGPPRRLAPGGARRKAGARARGSSAPPLVPAFRKKREAEQSIGRIPWPPREISGGEHRPGPDFSGHNKGANKCAGARRAQSPVCAAKPEPPDHRARGTRERLQFEGFPIQQSNKRTRRFAKALSEVSFTAPHLVLGRSPPVGIVQGRSDGLYFELAR
jgi:hypothetical protein